MPTARLRAGRWRFAFALVGALVAHGLVALWLSRAQPARSVFPAPEQVAVEVRFETVSSRSDASANSATGSAALQNSAPAVASSASDSASPAASSGSPPRAVIESLQRAASRSSSAPAQLLSPSAEAKKLEDSSAKGGAGPSKRDESWAAAEGLLLAPQNSKASPFGVTKTLQDPLAALGPSLSGDRPGAGTFDNGFGQGPQGPVRVPSAEEAAAEEKLIVQARVNGWILDAQAFARADPTRDRDGYWQDVQDVLEKDFAPGWSMLEAQPGHATSRAPKAIRVVTEQYLKAAQNFGKTGSPLAPGQAQSKPSMNQDLASAMEIERGLAGSALEAADANAMQQMPKITNIERTDSPWTQSLIVHVMLSQRPDGGLEDVSIAGSSGNAVYDAMVLGQARSLSAHGLLGPPPKDHRKTIWAFEANFTQVPPMPIAGCQLDMLFIPRDCYYPMQKRVKSRVRLEAVY